MALNNTDLIIEISQKFKYDAIRLGGALCGCKMYHLCLCRSGSRDGGPSLHIAHLEARPKLR